MKSIRLAIVAATLSLALAGCGDADDASEDAIADSVEMPADEAMADAPMPAQDVAPVADPAEGTDTVDEVETDAQQAADEAQAAVDDVINAAEENIETN